MLQKKLAKDSSSLSTNEIVAIVLSRYLENHSIGFAGTGSLIGVGACLLAQDLHAPDLSWMAGESGFINPAPPLVKSISGYSPRTEATKSINAIMRYLARGVDFFIAEAGQIDGQAKINRQLMPDGNCAAGTGSTVFLQRSKQALLFVTEHNSTKLAKEISFTSARRTIVDPEALTILVTPKCIFEWKENDMTKNSGKQKKSLIPVLTNIFDKSNSPEEIKKITGFDFEVSSNIDLIPVPSAEEIDSLREVVDPYRYLIEYSENI